MSDEKKIMLGALTVALAVTLSARDYARIRRVERENREKITAWEQDILTVIQNSRDETIDRLRDPSVSVGSSRVDLQACKLEYSIVSPK